MTNTKEEKTVNGDLEMQGECMEIVKSIKRLEEVGNKYFKCTNHMREALYYVGNLIAEHIPEEINLPRGYKIVKLGYYGLEKHFHCTRWDYALGKGDTVFCGINGYLWEDEPSEESLDYGVVDLTPPSRKECMDFARDILQGFINEICDLLDKRIMENQKCIEIAESAKVVLTEVK